jgi:hypothetical protein
MLRAKAEAEHKSASAFIFSLLPFRLAGLRGAIALSMVAVSGPAWTADGITELLRRAHWGETSAALFEEFRAVAVRLPRALDFGDSYVNVVVNGETVGGVPVVVFFQMDKSTHGLKRIQLERPRHGVNPPAFRAISAALHTAYGKPDKICVVPARPVGGYQAAAQELWIRGNEVISAIYRDTTLEAFEGCLFGITSGNCGLTGQLLVRVSPSDGNADPDPCSLASISVDQVSLAT